MRNRGRDDAGKSASSWRKHALIAKAAKGQIAAWRCHHRDGRIAIFDMHAGDGDGVMLPGGQQPNLFGWETISTPTAALAAALGEEYRGDVYLCERDQAKRTQLAGRFPGSTILADHSEAPSYADPRQYGYALVLCDACGPKEQGVERVQEILRRIPRADALATFNVQFVDRLLGVAPPNGDNDTPSRRGWTTSLQKYGPMADPYWWMRTLDRRRFARSERVNQSPGFQFHLFVVANYLSQPVQREPFEVIR